ncbi:protein transport protein Sec24D-like [Phymastichus coffea]|uniref:protein transport protein Sec24D-like n=1 Tax=Phymastichus coffea TaxID=108790 RepID=UPI00273C0CF9|nr:protein transport protein Sec24D-like [Phymastichus coffea]
MNPQYMQQQASFYGAQTSPSYREPNANLPPNGVSSGNNVPPTNMPPFGNNAHQSLQPIQNNLIDQMSNISLSGPPKPGPPTQAPPQMFASPQNGISNQNHVPPNGDPTRSAQAPPQQKPPSVQSSLPFSQTSSTIPQFPGQQYSGQPADSMSGLNIPRNTPNNNHMPGKQNSSLMPGQQPNQIRGMPVGQPSLGGPHVSGQTSSFSSNQQNLSSPPMPVQNFSSSQPPTSQPNMERPSLPSQPGHLPRIPGQQQFNQPPGPQHLSGPPMGNQSNLSRPPMPGQPNFQSLPPFSNQRPGQQPYMSGPPLPGQQNGPYGINQGYPPQPGQPPMFENQPTYPGGMPSGPGSYPAAQAQQGKKLDPDQMPSPIAVFQDDQKMKGGDFITNQKGLVPPLVTTKCIVHDQGNASPRFIRSTMYSVPTTSDIMKHTQVPFALILCPMAQVEDSEYEPPIVDMGEIGPVRCIRCKAYMCPFMQFIDAGRRFQCMFCKATTEVPAEYFQHLDHTGQRLDRHERPELVLGTFEFIATKDYCRDNILPKPPALIFVIDVSYNNIKSGLVNLLCSEIKNILKNLPIDAGQQKSNMKVGFITYNSSIQFYNCKANLAQPQMLYVSDVQDVFMPLLEGFLCDPEESESTIDSLMGQIPIMFGDTRETETMLGPAIQAGLEALKAAECAGKLLIFHSSLPIGEAPGKLKNRDDRNVLGSEKEKSILAPQTNFYNTLGQDCVGAGCSVDLFLFNNSYIDVATIGQISRLTGGEIYKYTYFQADIDGERLITDIINNISRPIAFDAVMRVRTSTGVRPTDFYGHLYMSNTTDIELASIDCDKAIAIEVKHDDKLTDEEGVYIQAALLYTSCSGVRRLRIINLSLKTSSMITELYKSCDLDAMINFMLKQSVSKLVEYSPKQIKDGLNTRAAAMLAAYRKHCANPSSGGQLILPESMKLLPLYICSMIKSDALTGGAGITVDQKAFVMMLISSMPIIETVAYVYPRLLALHNLQGNGFPPMLRCSIDRFEDNGVYLLENGIHMFMWLGLNVNTQWIQAVFGVASVAQVDTDKTGIPTLDNALNKQVREVISQVQSERRYCMRLTLTRQREKMEMVMRHYLVEDRGNDGSLNYTDFLCHMHGEIRSLLS